ncbi:thioesterase II family protein [Thalassospira mesophila]|nr:alpha/beta fold hydrolase [Thalassospira mesophila]
MIKSAWLAQTARHADAHTRLFCFPCAGGGASFYRSWKAKLPVEIDVIPICLPGREQRTAEPAIDNIAGMIPALADAILPLLDRPFAFFGYSMGGMIAHHLACRLAGDGHPSPDHLFIAALRGPNIPLRRSPVHSLSSEALWDEIGRYGGTPQEILESAEFKSLLEPSLRADFKLAETTFSGDQQKLTSAITVFGGMSDSSPIPEELEGWREATTGPVKTHLFDGGHFFINMHDNALLSIIANILDR